MKLFRRKREDTTIDVQAEKLANIIIQRQWQLAFFLNQKIQKLSPIVIKIWMIGFTAAFGTYCLYLIFQAFN